MFETGIARAAAQRCTDDDVAKLRRALDANVDARGDLERFERTDVAFHYVLATITRNPIYIAVHDGLVEWLTSQRTISLQAPGAEAAAVNGHRRVFEGVAKRDPEAAARAMEDHLTTVAKLFRRVVEAHPIPRRRREVET
jgi:DNA-binding FadR family transcriptional regulator